MDVGASTELSKSIEYPVENQQSAVIGPLLVL
jgi:hypothetical protein